MLGIPGLMGAGRSALGRTSSSLSSRLCVARARAPAPDNNETPDLDTNEMSRDELI